MRVLKTAPGEVLNVAFSPDCRAVAAAVDGAGIFLWNLDSPNIAPVRLEAEGGYGPGGLSFSACGRQLAWLAANGQRVYDRDTRTATTTANPAAPGAYECSNVAGARVVSNHVFPNHCLIGWKWIEDEWVRQWEFSTLDFYISSLTLGPSGDRFAVFTRRLAERGEEHPWELEVRDAATSTKLAVGAYPYSYATKSLQFHPAGEQIVGIHEMTLLAWALPTGGDPRLARNDSRKHFTALAYHPSGHQFFATSNDATIHVFDAHSLDRVNRYSWQLDKLSAIAVSPNGTLAAAGSANGDVVVWDLD